MLPPDNPCVVMEGEGEPLPTLPSSVASGQALPAQQAKKEEASLAPQMPSERVPWWRNAASGLCEGRCGLMMDVRFWALSFGGCDT